MIVEGNSLFSVVEIEINRRCNRACSYCPNSIVPRAGEPEMDRVLFSKIVSDLHSLDFKGRLSFHFYNEPLLHPDLEGLVTELHAALPLVNIQIYTNGTLLTLDHLRRLLALGVGQFVVTRQEGERTYPFDTVYSALTSEEKNRVVYRSFEQVKLTNRGGMMGNRACPDLRHAPCLLPEMIVVITADGNVLPCFEDFKETQVMGSLKISSLGEIWNTKRYKYFRETLSEGGRSRFPVCLACDRTEVLAPNKGQG